MPASARIQPGFWALIALLIACAPAAWGAPEIRFARLGMAEGLSQSSVMAITQCHDGYMWFGTQYGLDRFDGHDVRSFRHDPQDPLSLSHSRVNALKTAADGRLWVATGAGLDRFDPRAGQAERFAFAGPMDVAANADLTRVVVEHSDGRVFLSASGAVRIWRPDDEKVHRIPFDPEIEASQLALRSEVLDQQERYWVFNAAGLWRLDERTQRMRLVLPVPRRPDFRMYSALALTADGLLALAADDVFKLVDPDTLEILERLDLEDLGGVDERINGVMTSSDGLVWLPTPKRLLRYRPSDRSLHVMFAGSRLDPTENARQQLKLVEHPNGDLWFPSQYGLGWVQPSTGQVRVMAHDPADPFSMPQSIPQVGITAYIDDEGNVWVGTHLGGVGWHAPSNARFRHIRDRSRPTLSSLPYAGQNVVRSIVETRIGEHVDLWLALDRAGVRRLRLGQDDQFHWHQSFHVRGDEPERLAEDQVWSLAADPLSSLVWVLGTDYLVAMDGQADRVVERYSLAELGLGSASGRFVLISRDGSRLWLATWSGVWQFELGPDRGRPQLLDATARIDHMLVFKLVELDDGQIMAVGDSGAALLQPGSREPVWVLDHEALQVPRPSELHSVAPHPGGGWWLGGRELGLGHLRVEPGMAGEMRVSVDWFNADHGLFDETIYAILPEPNGQLWLSSNNGLMRWDPDSQKVRHFTPPDGVQAFEFNQAAAFRSERGYFYFGGVNGVNQFRPEQLDSLQRVPRLRLQEVRINGALIDLTERDPGNLRLRHGENDLEIHFVGLKFADPQRVRYAFRLEGADANWIEGGASRQVRYASLQPGTYRFHVRAANSDGIWSDEEILLSAVVSPPPWATPWALAFYGLFLIIAAGVTYGEHLRRRRALEAEVAARTATLTEQRGLIARQARELEQALEARTVLFANVSHEFRTPLTLIKTSLDRIEREGVNEQAIALGRRYLRRLLKLVDQLMDFSRLSHEQCDVDRKPWPLGRMVRMTVDAFAGVAEERGIEIIVEVEYGWRTRCDQEQVEKILLNLLTNALKFTPSGGQVRVKLAAEKDGVCLSVADSGPGIPERDLETIFERFYRVPAVEQHAVAGAGIGLALVREAAQANGGHVGVHSAPGEGSCFTVFLPAWQEPNAAGPVVLLTERDQARDIEALKPHELTEDRPESQLGTERPVVLVVEDNPDMRGYLVELLLPRWTVLEAGDGVAGLALARAEIPDVIVSDIMMPGMDGLDLLAALRTDIATSHIPVMLLTARQDHETRIRSFALQADDFLPKPFDDEEFCVRLSAMMETRRRLREQLRRELDRGLVGPGSESSLDADISDRDRELLARLQAWAEESYSDPDLKVSDLADAALVDVRTLQRKLKSLLDRSPAAYLQELRLTRARELLLANGRSIKDIAVSCGFSSPQAFTKVFTQAEGMPPSQWRRLRSR